MYVNLNTYTHVRQVVKMSQKWDKTDNYLANITSQVLPLSQQQDISVRGFYNFIGSLTGNVWKLIGSCPSPGGNIQSLEAIPMPVPHSQWTFWGLSTLKINIELNRG